MKNRLKVAAEPFVTSIPSPRLPTCGMHNEIRDLTAFRNKAPRPLTLIGENADEPER
jgi:hypothetical protein